MTFQNLMIDTETAGIGADGALMSIGAVWFDYRTGELGPTFEQTIHLATSVRDGGVIEPGTFLFWLGQDQKARDAVRFGGRDIRVVLQEFSDWIAETCRHEDVIPWANSPSFDLMKISRACERIGMKTPWYWNKERCFRTVRNMYPKVEYNPEDKGDSAHTALADAIFQARHMMKIAGSLRRGA